MPATLRDELRQNRPFGSLEQEAHLSIQRTATLLEDSFERMLKPRGISAVQFNVLRILRGAEPQALCRNEIRDRLLTRMPDVTRLLDRMEEAGLVSRERSTEDRRQVGTRLTARGRRLVDSLDDAVIAEHHDTLGHLTRDELRTLIDLLARVRSPG